MVLDQALCWAWRGDLISFSVDFRSLALASHSASERASFKKEGRNLRERPEEALWTSQENVPSV